MYNEEQKKRIKELIKKAEKCGMVHRLPTNDPRILLILEEAQLSEEEDEYYNKI